MVKQQTRRRRKRYTPGSAYAGHVKPTGVLGFMGSTTVIRVVFIAMALALVVGGFAGLIRSGLIGGAGSSNPAGFVIPEDEEDSDETPQPGATVEVRRYAAPPEMTIDIDKSYTATIKTELGDIEIELLADQAPQTVNNFVFLAGDGFYDGLVFHDVVSGFSATAGDPTCTAGGSMCRGTGGPGYTIPDEPSDTSFGAGVLGMATRPNAPDSGGSQFFIALSNSKSDADQYEGFTAFGRIVSGLDLAEQLVAGTEIQTVEIQEQ